MKKNEEKTKKKLKKIITYTFKLMSKLKRNTF